LTKPKREGVPVNNLNIDLLEDTKAAEDLETQQVLHNEENSGRKEDHFHHVLREQRQKVKEVYSQSNT
jgi:hypothetical protein